MQKRSAPRERRSERWQRRWSSASGLWVGVAAALLLGGINWRTAVMAAATAFMLARVGDMRDDDLES